MAKVTDEAEVARLAAAAPDTTKPGPAVPGEPWMVDGSFDVREGTRQRFATLAEAASFRDDRIRETGKPHGVYDAVTGRIHR